MTVPDRRGAAAALMPGAPGPPPQDAAAGARRPAHAEPRTPDELHTDLRRLRALLAGRQPAEAQTGLVSVENGREMLAGTTVIALQTRFVARPNGLLIPAGAAPMPLDLASVYLTGDEVFGVAPSPAVTVDELGRMPFPFVLAFVAATLAEHRNPGVPSDQLDLAFAERWLAGPARVRVRNLLRNPLRRLIVPQALYVLVKLAARYSPDAALPGTAAPRPAIALFGALGVVDDEHASLDHQDHVIDTEVTPLVSRLLANQHLNKPLDEDHLMARFVRQWLELPAERAGERRVLDLEQTFADVTGVPLRDVLVVAVPLWARAALGQPYVPPEYVAVPGWSRERVSRALDVFSADPVTLRGAFLEETEEDGAAWTFSALERYPVVRFDDGALLVVDRNLLVRRIFGGLTVYDITDPLDRGDRAAQKRADRVRGCVQNLAEVYALELLEDVAGAPGDLSGSRVFGEKALQAAFSRKGRRLADAAVDYGDAWVVAEITTSKLKRASVAASPEALSDDLDKLVGKVEQLDSTIAALRAEESALTGAPAIPGRRFHPLLVVAEGFPVNPVSTELLRQRVRHRGLLTGADVAPLEVVDTVELAMLQALTEQGGPSMRDVLAGKERAVFYRASVRDYLLRECAYQPRRATRVAELMHRALGVALDALRPHAA